MQTNTQDIKMLTNEFGLPLAEMDNRIWFFRTQSGTYYYDFRVNRYIALGWDLIPVTLIKDKRKSDEGKKEEIAKLYPDHERPGLIFGQMDLFYNKMIEGDLVAIPSTGGKRIAIGVLGKIVTDIKHKESEDEYERCEYKHKRTVKWIKEIDSWTDVYLFRILRAQQTISDITKYAELIYRNLHPCYVSGNMLHLTLQKTTEAEYRIKDNIDLQVAILDINSILTEYYGVQDESEKISIKTAVGSPGFIEIILPYIPISALTAMFVFRAIVGKIKLGSGESATGIMAILAKGNELINDHTARKKMNAETAQIMANTAKTYAEAAQIEATTKRMNTESQEYLSSIEENCDELSAKYILTDRAEKASERIAENTRKLQSVAVKSGVRFDKEIKDVS